MHIPLCCNSRCYFFSIDFFFLFSYMCVFFYHLNNLNFPDGNNLNNFFFSSPNLLSIFRKFKLCSLKKKKTKFGFVNVCIFLFLHFRYAKRHEYKKTLQNYFRSNKYEDFVVNKIYYLFFVSYSFSKYQNIVFFLFFSCVVVRQNGSINEKICLRTLPEFLSSPNRLPNRHPNRFTDN